jgi:hypothetical protein
MPAAVSGDAKTGATKKQEFGYRGGDHDGDGKSGEIGGRVWRSLTPAHYGQPVGPFSFNDALSASGTLVLLPQPYGGGAYFGFYNSTKQTWRPWSSMAIRIGDFGKRPDGSVFSDSHLDYMATDWKAGGFSTLHLPADGKPHKWAMKYEPDVTVAAEWPHPKLKAWLGDRNRTTEEELLKFAHADGEADMTPQKIKQLVNEGQYRGQIEFHTRRGVGWQTRPNPQEVKGRITFHFDGQRFSHFVNNNIRQQDLKIDRFGIFNFQLPGDVVEFYLSDLVVNEKKIDLAKDPGWTGVGNEREFVDKDFHGKHDFGYSRTNHAGQSPGEIGGMFWRTEPDDPVHGYYAVDIGKLTLEDPIRFSGSVAFTNGGTDAGMCIGYFNTADKMKPFRREDGGEAGAPLPNWMGCAIEGPTRIGYFFSAQISPKDRSRAGNTDGPVFIPDGKRHRFTFEYDPAFNDNVGRMRMTFDDGKEYLYNLSKEQRAAGATFDRFGLLNLRRGGKHVEVYYDDLTFTRRGSGQEASLAKHQEKRVRVPYPKGGRKY